MSKILDDGFGNRWLTCAHPKCDLEIVRPGKVQCSGYCEDLSLEELLSHQYFGGEPMTSKPNT